MGGMDFMKFIKKYIIYFTGIFSSIALMLVLTLPALAWSWEGGRTTLGELTYKFQDDTSTSIRAAFMSSYLSWETAVYYVDFTSTDGNPDFYLFEEYLPDYPYMEGRYFRYSAPQRVQCELNTFLVTQLDYNSFRREGCAGHELGHGLGLEHNYSYSIMDNDGSRRFYTNGIYTPATNDVNSMNSQYPW
jgi:hypothetical protein